MIEHRHAADNDRGVLMGLVETDSAAFDEVMEVIRRSTETDAEKKKKDADLEAATIKAASMPLETIRHSYKALTHAKVAAEKGNKNTITDAGVAAHALMAAMEGAALNVRVNLGNIKTKDFVQKTTREVETLLSDGRKLKAEVLEIVEARMKDLAKDL